MNKNNTQNSQNSQNTSNKTNSTNKVNTSNKLPNNYVSQSKINIMDLEKLKLEYKSQLTAYKQAVTDYIAFLKNNTKYNTSTVADYDINKTPYVEVKGRSFWGSGKADSQDMYKGGNIEQCKALCSKTSNCTGATFSAGANGEPMCWLRTGDGEIMPALDTDYAIVPEAKKYLSAIESINKKLLETNTKIQEIVKKAEPLYNSIKLKSEAQNDDLLKNYVQLTAEREKIQKMLESYQDLDKMETQGDLKINQKYYTFVLLFIIAISIVILLYKSSGLFNSESSSSNYTSSNYIQQGGELSQSTYLFVLMIIIFIILVNYFTNIKNTTIGIKDGFVGIFSSFFSMIGSFFTIND